MALGKIVHCDLALPTTGRVKIGLELVKLIQTGENMASIASNGSDLVKIGQIFNHAALTSSASVLNSKHYPDLHLSFLQLDCQNLAQNIHISQ